MRDPYLQVSGLTKSYGNVQALGGVSLDVEKGEFVTFLGPSGSGKTTTLMIIAGFENATSGSVRVGGRSLSNIPPHARNIGIVFQNYALFPHKTALQNIMFPLDMRGVPSAEAERKARAMLDLVGLSGYGDRWPKDMSGGQQQRIALARALVFEPSLLLLDEPLGALDKNLREQMQIEIKRIQKSLGVTTIFVTHDQSEAMTMSDRIAVFEKGRIDQIGTPQEVYRTPSTPFVARFIGDSNLLPGTVLDPDQGLVRTEHLGLMRLPNRLAAAAGAPVTLMLRPESIHLAGPAAGAGDDAPNRADISVHTVVPYGDSTLLIGRAGGADLRIRLRGPEADGIGSGAALSVLWPASAIHAIPAV